MRAKGKILYYGHRAFGSLIGYIALIILMVAGYIYAYFKYHSILEEYITVQGYHIKYEYFIWIAVAIVVIILIYKHYYYTYVITTEQIISKQGIIASYIKSYLYSQIQEVNADQGIGERILLYGKLSVTMLITFTGQSQVEKATLYYIHRPRQISYIMQSNIKVGSL